jgi:hypothetical protein
MEIPTGMPDEYWHEDWKNDWTQLGDYEIIKPSGLPFGTIDNNDKAMAIAGHQFNINQLVPVRYLRFSVKTTFIGANDNVTTLHELRFYGTDRIE